jgi:SAM-dependent methyltransferase
VLDIGSHDGALFRAASGRIREGIGIDPEIPASRAVEGGRLIRGWFPADLPDSEPFDAICLLAVLEHIPSEVQARFARACARSLRPRGRLIITVPAPAVDRILAVLTALRLVDGMSLEQHYGFEPRMTPGIFEPAGFELVAHRTFQLGLNNLFVFERRAA